MDKKIILNFIYNTGYQILTLILPFITIPYISRIFSPGDIGVYSSTLSTVQLFSIMGMFAVGAYGVKEIAANRDKKEKLSEKFYQIRFMQKITVSISLILYLLFFTIINSKNRAMYLIQSIHLISSLVDITWLFGGLEDFKKTVIRNIIVKLGSLGLIFIIVKQPKDILLYAFILALSMLLGNISMWVYVKNVIIKNITVKRDLKRNILMATSLLVPQVAFQIYTSFDRTILGVVYSMDAVGMFDQSQKIVRMAVGIVTSLSLVMLPRVTNMISANKDNKEINELLKKSLNITLFISIACSFGINGISENFVPWFYGEEYLGVSLLLNMTSIVCVLTAVGSFLSNQYAIPKGNKKAYMIPIVTAAIVSITLGIFLGRWYGAIGACATIIITEFIALGLRLVYLRKDLNYRYLFSDLYKFILSGIFMIAMIKLINKICGLTPGIPSTIIEVVFGGVAYCLSIIILNKEYLITIKRVLNDKFRVTN